MLDTVRLVQFQERPAALNRKCYRKSFPSCRTSETPSRIPIHLTTENCLVALPRKYRMPRREFGDTLSNGNGLRPRYHHQRHIRSCRKDTHRQTFVFSSCSPVTRRPLIAIRLMLRHMQRSSASSRNSRNPGLLITANYESIALSGQ